MGRKECISSTHGPGHYWTINMFTPSLFPLEAIHLIWPSRYTERLHYRIQMLLLKLFWSQMNPSNPKFNSGYKWVTAIWSFISCSKIETKTKDNCLCNACIVVSMSQVYLKSLFCGDISLCQYCWNYDGIIIIITSNTSIIIVIVVVVLLFYIRIIIIIIITLAATLHILHKTQMCLFKMCLMTQNNGACWFYYYELMWQLVVFASQICIIKFINNLKAA